MATDRAFEVTVTQPVARGVMLSPQVVHRIILPRGDEARLMERRAARLEAEARVRAERVTCASELRTDLRSGVGPTLDLLDLLEEAGQRRGLFSGESVEVRALARAVGGLVSEARGHAADAERALATLDGPLAVLPELRTLLDAHDALVTAWDGYRVALERLAAQQGIPGGDPLASETDELSLRYGIAVQMQFDAERAVEEAIGPAVERACAARHPLP